MVYYKNTANTGINVRLLMVYYKNTANTGINVASDTLCHIARNDGYFAHLHI
jgi:hypothetical protein